MKSSFEKRKSICQIGTLVVKGERKVVNYQA